ncbi:MAG TPA: YlxR family protein [Candidatus Aphodovivens avistercoris]|nr:YlxR family protein [Candidatus Aphodovivens avistercoris]
MARDGGKEGAAKRQRTCVACGKQAGKAQLHRIARTPEGAVAYDAGGRMPGRGAYVCSPACLAAACKAKKLERALKTKLDSNEYEQIEAALASALREAQGIEEE